MPTITRRFEIDYGHRVLGHEGKCNNYHGHRGVIDVRVSAQGLDGLGRVIDFAVVKQALGPWLDDALDHAMVLTEGDPLIGPIRETGSRLTVLSTPTTSEHLAEYVLANASRLLRPHGVQVESVVFHETPNCAADAHRRAEPDHV